MTFKEFLQLEDAPPLGGRSDMVDDRINGAAYARKNVRDKHSLPEDDPSGTPLPLKFKKSPELVFGKPRKRIGQMPVP